MLLLCRQCDFLAIQEVQDSLESLRHLRDRLGPKYSLVVSDIAGGVPGRSYMRERLAFLFNTRRIIHTELASDITFERSAIVWLSIERSIYNIEIHLIFL